MLKRMIACCRCLSIHSFNTLCALTQDNSSVNTFGLPTRGAIFAQQALLYLPDAVFWLMEQLPSRSLKWIKEVARVGNKVALDLIQERKVALSSGLEAPPNDVLSLLCKLVICTSVC